MLTRVPGPRGRRRQAVQVAQLRRRDGCIEVVVNGGSGDLAADVVAYLADGRKLVIQCKKRAPHRSVSSQDMQKFVGTARPEHGADIALRHHLPPVH
ncbi:restriction endonuclease [Streptomyces albidoflavus]